MDVLVAAFESMESRFAEHAKKIYHDTIPAPPMPPERWPNLVAIGLGDAIDAIERVVTWAQQGKHKGQKWASQDEYHQQAKLLGHLARGMKGDIVDEDTGEHAYAHVAARALMLLGLALLSRSEGSP